MLNISEEEEKIEGWCQSAYNFHSVATNEIRQMIAAGRDSHFVMENIRKNLRDLCHENPWRNPHVLRRDTNVKRYVDGMWHSLENYDVLDNLFFPELSGKKVVYLIDHPGLEEIYRQEAMNCTLGAFLRRTTTLAVTNYLDRSKSRYESLNLRESDIGVIHLYPFLRRLDMKQIPDGITELFAKYAYLVLALIKPAVVVPVGWRCCAAVKFEPKFRRFRDEEFDNMVCNFIEPEDDWNIIRFPHAATSRVVYAINPCQIYQKEMGRVSFQAQCHEEMIRKHSKHHLWIVTIQNIATAMLQVFGTREANTNEEGPWIDLNEGNYT